MEQKQTRDCGNLPLLVMRAWSSVLRGLLFSHLMYFFHSSTCTNHHISHLSLSTAIITTVSTTLPDQTAPTPQSPHLLQVMATITLATTSVTNHGDHHHSNHISHHGHHHLSQHTWPTSPHLSQTMAIITVVTPSLTNHGHHNSHCISH